MATDCTRLRDLQEGSGAPRRLTLRRIAAVLLALAALPDTVVRDSSPQWDHRRALAVARIAAPPAAATDLGPFRLRGVWQLVSSDIQFGGYSALLPRAGGRLLAISDRGTWLEFAEPIAAKATSSGPIESHDHAMGHLLRDRREWTSIGDAEAATTDGDPGKTGGHIWISWEDRHAVSRFDTAPEAGWWHERRGFPTAMKNWSPQFGAESMVRLPDGRFIIVSEDFALRSYERRHRTLLFPGDPTAPKVADPAIGELTADAGYRPTDIVRLPDGRVLVLLRRLVWPLPLRFSCRIAIADPHELFRTGRWTARTLARLDAPLPTDNFEGLTVRPRADGKLDVWVIADNNRAATQRTLLLKLELDPQDLPAR